jgi:hypothetical protein
MLIVGYVAADEAFWAPQLWRDPVQWPAQPQGILPRTSAVLLASIDHMPALPHR